MWSRSFFYRIYLLFLSGGSWREVGHWSVLSWLQVHVQGAICEKNRGGEVGCVLWSCTIKHARIKSPFQYHQGYSVTRPGVPKRLFMNLNIQWKQNSQNEIAQRGFTSRQIQNTFTQETLDCSHYNASLSIKYFYFRCIIYGLLVK